MASAVKMPLADLLNMLLVPSTTTHKVRRASSETALQPSREERFVKRKSVYLSARTAQILVETAAKSMESESHIVNEALIFYNERGQYIEELIKKSIQEALGEMKPVAVRPRALVRRADKPTNMG